MDGAGYQYAVFVVTLGAIGAGGGSTVKVQESATSGGSFTDVAGSSVVIGDTDDESVKVIAVDLQKRSRYLKMAGTTPGASTSMAAICVLVWAPLSTGVPARALLTNIYYCLYGVILLLVLVTDLEHRLVPHAVLLPAIALATLAAYFLGRTAQRGQVSHCCRKVQPIK